MKPPDGKYVRVRVHYVVDETITSDTRYYREPINAKILPDKRDRRGLVKTSAECIIYANVARIELTVVDNPGPVEELT